jgi:hypothetical protein
MGHVTQGLLFELLYEIYQEKRIGKNDQLLMRITGVVAVAIT